MATTFLKGVQEVKQLFYFIYKIKMKKDIEVKLLVNKLHINSYILGNFNCSTTPAYPTDLSLT